MLQKIENIQTKTDKVTSSIYNIFGNEMVFYSVLPFNDTNFKVTSTSHLWSNLNMYGEINYNIANKQITEGGLLNSAFEGIPPAFWNTGMIVGAFNNDTYRVNMNGHTIGISIPLNSSYTGMTSGLTATTLYSSFIWDSNSLELDPKSFCAITKQDNKISETLSTYTDKIGLGFSRVEGSNPPDSKTDFYSGLVYLVSQDIYKTFTGGTGSSVSWSYGFGRNDKYAIGGRSIDVSFGHTNHTGYYDTIVGMLNLNSGMFYIWDKNLVQGFDWTNFTGDPLTGATTTSGVTYSVVKDMDEEVKLGIDILVKPGQWQDTTNPSIIGETCGTVFTSICLYDEQGNLLGVAKPNEAIILPKDGYTPLSLEVPISGNINEDGIWSTRGIISGYGLGAS